MQQIERVTNSQAEEAIRNRTPFTNANGSLHSYIPGQMLSGRLPDVYLLSFGEALKHIDFYAVYSYDTPIAWFANCEWHVPRDTYSPTTSKHQAIVRRAIA